LNLPNINFSAVSNVTSSAAGKNPDAALLSNLISSKSSQQLIDDQRNSSNNLGAYEPVKVTSSPMSFAAGSLSKKIDTTTGNDLISSDNKLSTSKTYMSTETPNLSKTSITGRKFTFTSPFNSMQSSIVTVNDNKNTSTRKFTLTSPIFLDQLHSDIEKPIEEEHNKENSKKHTVDDPTVDRECSKCGYGKMSYTTLQLRSADEGQTVFFTCLKCKHKEVENS